MNTNSFIKTNYKRWVAALGWVSHPISIFVGLQIVWVAITVLWVIWFINQKEVIGELSQTLGRKNIDPTYGIAFLIIGCILLGIVLIGIVYLFAVAQRQKYQNKQQKIFVSSVTHELRTPLASLQLSFETLKKGPLEEQIIKKLYTMVGMDIERLARLIDQILVSAKLDRGILDFYSANESFTFEELIKKIERQMNHLDKNIQGRLSHNFKQNLEIQGMRMALELIIGNLLENAIKYSPRGSAIEIFAEKIQHNLVIRIEDHGYGFEKKDSKKIFKLFHRSQLASKKAIPGTGLGLHIVKTTASILGGKVSATSKGMGNGSVFEVFLPIIEYKSPNRIILTKGGND